MNSPSPSKLPEFRQDPAFSRRNSPDPASRGHNDQYSQVRNMQTSADELLVDQKNTNKQFKSDALDRMAKAEYQPAVFLKAVQYRNERSYSRKIENSYQKLDLLADTNELRYFGLGPYFHIEFMRRLCWLLLVMMSVQAVTIYINYSGTGLKNYSVSYFSYLIKSTIGNYSGSVLTAGYDGYIVALTPALNYLILFIFYLIWKVHFFRAIAEQDDDNKDVKPEKFCVEIEGLPQGYINQAELQRFFTAFGPVYEVSVVRNYQNKLQYFQELDQLEEAIKEQELEFALGGDESNRKEMAKKNEEREKLEKKLAGMQIYPSTVSAFVHFQFQKSKVECVSYFNDHYLFDKCCHNCMRSLCCCCLNDPDQRAVFHNHLLLVANDRPAAPADINWEHFELGCFGKTVRILFAMLIILAFLALSTTIIGICGIYISSHSNDCDGMNTASYTASSATATGDSEIIRCYCNANLVASFTDNSIKSACSDYLTDIYVEQAIQYVVLITEVVSNIIFGVIVDKLVNCIRPSSQASGLFLKTILLTAFLIINTIGVPVLIYANIFGFEPTRYVSFLTIISSDIMNFLKVQSLSFYPSFTSVWYRNVSPIFINFVVFNTIGVWASYLFIRCCCTNKDSLQDDQQRVLQKTMNRKMTDFKLDVGKEASNLYLILYMALLFMAGIPVILPLAFLNIISRYLVNRSLLQSHSTKVEGLGEDVASLTLILLPFILIVCPLLGEWMLISNDSIYPNGIPTTFTFLDFLKGNFDQLDKQIYLPFYLLISVLALGEVVLYMFVIKFCACLCGLCYEKKEVLYHSRPFSEYTKNINVLTSYNIRNNDNMRNAILHLEKYLVNKEQL